jgi:hypothetical protein
VTAAIEPRSRRRPPMPREIRKDTGHRCARPRRNAARISQEVVDAASEMNFEAAGGRSVVMPSARSAQTRRLIPGPGYE